MNKIIFSIFIIVFLFKTGNVFSSNDIFYVDNIIVKDEKNQDREILLNSAFKEGFERLIRKILLKKDHELVLKTSLKDIKKMVSTYQIKHNQNLNKKNELAINISFDREKLNSFFYSKNISYADISKTNLVLFPILVEENNFYLFSDNYFFTNWNIEDENSKNEFVDYILPVENLEDIQFIKKNKDDLESIDVKAILSKYDIENYLFLVIRPSEKKTNIFLKGVFSDNKVVKNFIAHMDSEDKSYSFKQTIKNIKQEINEIWKSQNLIDVRTPSFLNIILNIKEKDDLLKTQIALKKIKLIENFYVFELTKDYAKIRIKYYGKTDKMKDKFYEKGIQLDNSDVQWRINLI